MLVGSHGSKPTKRERAIPRGVYHLMCLTGATLSEALQCWSDADGEFYLAVQIFEERHDAHKGTLEPPASHQQDNAEKTAASANRDKSSNFLTPLLDHGAHFLKGVLAAALIYVAVEVL